MLYNESMKKNVREPKQERANETKQKIIEAGYKVFAEEGYYSANTPEIAKAAGVSTGIVYNYFSDKRDILLRVLDIYINDVTRPFEKLLEDLASPIDFYDLTSKFIDTVIKTHKDNSRLHNALHTLEASDEEVNAVFMRLQDNLTKSISSKLSELGYDKSDLKERVHLAMNAAQSFAHEYVYDTHDYLDYDVMKKVVVKMTVSLFE